jgi:hypothetical protein
MISGNMFLLSVLTTDSRTVSRRGNTIDEKVSHLLENLPTSRQQIVLALLVPSCQHFWEQAVNNL